VLPVLVIAFTYPVQTSPGVARVVRIQHVQQGQ